MCVPPTGRSFLIVLDLRHASWPLHKGCLLSFYPAFPLADKIIMIMPQGMTKPDSLTSVDDTYDGPLLTNTPQYFFVTDFVRPRNAWDFSPKPQTSHSSAASTSPIRLQQRSTPNDSLYNSLLQAKADHEGSCQQFFSLSKRVLCSGYSRR